MNIQNIKDPQFLKQLNINELEAVAKDIREFLIQNVSKTGGHFSSNLGIVELTMALHYVFNSPQDKILFDVGHQSYVHKILTGRIQQFDTLRQYGGLSGFQKRKESPHDCFEAGHSSTAISGGIGLAVARDLNNQLGEVICVVGDGAIMSGESFEALNHLGSIPNKVIIILNDNNMSISQNVGGLSNILSDIRISTQYKKAKFSYTQLLNKTSLGRKIYQLTKDMKDRIKDNVLSDNIFAEFGLDYIGPVDGHDFHELINALQVAKELTHSVVIHVHTIKGKGYPLAENDYYGYYHGVAPFDYRTGIVKKESELKSWSEVVSNHVEKLMGVDEDIIAITPAMISGSCLQSLFEHYPKRSFDVGIAEEHAMTFAAGLSLAHKKPYITIYSSFIQRAYDQINHDIARMNLPCLIGVDRAGLVGADGETHHGVFDISILSSIPNLIIMTPKDSYEAKCMINTAFSNNDAPYVMRFPKGSIIDQECGYNECVEVGTWEKVIYNSDYSLTVITYNQKVDELLKLIDENDYPVNLINARFIKPMDTTLLELLYKDHQHLLIYETDVMIGSLGSMIIQYYNSHKYIISIDHMAIGDHYIPQGQVEELLDKEHLSLKDVKLKIEEILNEERKS